MGEGTETERWMSQGEVRLFISTEHTFVCKVTHEYKAKSTLNQVKSIYDIKAIQRQLDSHSP